MGRKRRQAAAEGDQQPKPPKQAKQQSGEPQQHEQVVPVVRLLAIDSGSSRVAVAVGSSLRVLNYSTGEVQHADEQHASAPLRALCFSPDGRLLLAAGDDHKARLLDTGDWHCVRTIQAPKKISAAAFTQDGAHAILGDKFGDVVIAPTTALNPSSSPTPDEAATDAAAEPAALLLGHLSTIVTSVAVTPDNGFVVTTDKDGKVRVSVLLQNAMKGSYEIQSYCFGHTSYVTCSLVLAAPDTGRTLLLTGGGDGTVRLWDPVEGQLLHTYVAAEPRATSTAEEQLPADAANGDASSNADHDAGADEQQQQQEQQQGQEQQQEQQEDTQAGEGQQGGEDGPLDCAVRQEHECAAVLSIAAAPDGRTLAVVVEGELEVQLLQLQQAAGANSLSCCQRLALPGVQAPCNVQFDGQGRLWVAGGPPVLQSSSVHMGVAYLAPAADQETAETAGEGGTAALSVAAGNEAAREGAAGGASTSNGHSQVYVDCTAAVLSAEGRAALEQRNEEEEAATAAGASAEGTAGAPVLRYSEHLKKRGYGAEGTEPKRHRRDFPETQRLSKLAEAHAEQQQQQQQQRQQKDEQS